MLRNRLLNLAVAVALITVIAFTVREAAASSVVTFGREAVKNLRLSVEMKLEDLLL